MKTVFASNIVLHPKSKPVVAQDLYPTQVPGVAHLIETAAFPFMSHSRHRERAQDQRSTHPAGARATAAPYGFGCFAGSAAGALPAPPTARPMIPPRRHHLAAARARSRP